MREKILLIDGHSILNRAFYGLPDLTNSQGLHTNAVYGFLNILFKVLEEEQAQYLTVAFDLHAPTFRHEMFKEYKGTRKPMPEELREQVPLIREVLKTMGVPMVSKEGYEADDLLGTLARKCEEELGMEVTILSGDRDLLQLATEHTLIRIPKTSRGGTTVEDYRASEVKEKYQVTPREFIDVKALMGDTADNIPGIPGVGEKTATKLIAAYGNIENAHAHIQEITPKKARESLENFYDQAVLSKRLAAIDRDSPIEFNSEEAKIGNLYTQEAYDLFKQLDFKNLLGKFDCTTAENQVEQFFTVCREFSQAEEAWKKAAQAQSAGICPIPGPDGLLGMSLAFSDKDIYYIPAEGFVTEACLRDKSSELAAQILVASMDVKELLKYTEIPGPGQAFDTGIAAYLLNPLKSQYTYDDISKEYLELMVPTREDLIGKLSYGKALEEKSDGLAMLACYMAYTAWASREKLEEALGKAKMEPVFRNIEMPLVFTLRSMESWGILVRAEELKTYGDELAVRIKELEQLVYRQAGEEFKINSPKQLGVILFEKLQMPGGKKTKTGYSTAADVLDKLAPEYPIVRDILEYRQLTKLKSTYADGLANYIGEDGRIHSSFNQTITATGRISSTEPNLQNIPIRMELGRLIRKVFVPCQDYVFLDADYSQIELRVLAHLSGDEKLIQAYREAEDIHRLTASQVFHTPFDQVTDLQRRNAKAVNFGIVYGISSFGLSQDLSITRKEAATYIENYFHTYPKIKGFLDGQVEHARECGYTETMFGRRRPIPELKSSNFMQRSFGERIAMNSPIQGTAADIIKIAMNRVHQRLTEGHLKSRLLLQVHDELLVETHKDELEQVSQILEEEMVGAAHLAVSLEVDMHTGNSWYEAK